MINVQFLEKRVVNWELNKSAEVNTFNVNLHILESPFPTESSGAIPDVIRHF